MATPSELSEKRFKNYCKARSVAVWFVFLGVILILGALSWATQPEGSEDPGRVVLAAFGVVVGLCGVIGGVAVRLDNPRWARLVKVIAWIYIWAFPVGTVLSLMLLDSLPGHAKYVAELRSVNTSVEDTGKAEDTW